MTKAIYCIIYYFSAITVNAFFPNHSSTSAEKEQKYQEKYRIHFLNIIYKMLPKTIKRILYYFDACGFSSGLSKFSTNRKAVCILSTVHILMATFFYTF